VQERDRTAASLAEFLEAYRPLVLTGAGMSTESGIPDYRGPDGRRRVTPMQHGEFVGSSEARRRYWARGFVGWARFSAAAPNAGHHALARLQRIGRIGTVVTQNVDGLHQAGGASDVVELHGSLADVVCLTCGDRSDRDLLQARMHDDNPEFAARASGAAPDGARVSSQIRPDGDIVLDDDVVGTFVVPLCRRCGADTLKPDVVFFGGSVPRDRVARVTELVAGCEGLLVLGSSLAVMSGYRFVRQAARTGIPVAILTHGPTRGDEQATLRLDAPLGATLAAAVEELVAA
jgi:NAD-dependent SIR2 family protein deacetylase